MNCRECDAPLREGTKFCGDCGAEVVQPDNSRCAYCGTEIHPGERFCIGCGKPVTQVLPFGKVCSKCGTKLESAAKFCASCGTLTEKEKKLQNSMDELTATINALNRRVSKPIPLPPEHESEPDEQLLKNSYELPKNNFDDIFAPRESLSQQPKAEPVTEPIAKQSVNSRLEPEIKQYPQPTPKLAPIVPEEYGIQHTPVTVPAPTPESGLLDRQIYTNNMAERETLSSGMVIEEDSISVSGAGGPKQGLPDQASCQQMSGQPINEQQFVREIEAKPPEPQFPSRVVQQMRPMNTVQPPARQGIYSNDMEELNRQQVQSLGASTTSNGHDSTKNIQEQPIQVVKNSNSQEAPVELPQAMMDNDFSVVEHQYVAGSDFTLQGSPNENGIFEDISDLLEAKPKGKRKVAEEPKEKKKISKSATVFIIIGIFALIVIVMLAWLHFLPGMFGGSGTPILPSLGSSVVSSTDSAASEVASQVEVSQPKEQEKKTDLSNLELSVKNKWDMAQEFDDYGFARVAENAEGSTAFMVGLIDKKGDYIIKPKYNYIGPIKEGRMAVSKDDKYGFVDVDGKEVIPPAYDESTDFFQGNAVVKKDGLYFHIDTFGERLLEESYDSATAFFDNKAVVKKNGKTYFVDSSGVRLDGEFEDARGFSEGLAAVKRNGKWGFVNSELSGVVNFEYDEVEDYNSGFALVKKGTDKFLINKWGIIASPSIDKAGEFSDDLIVVEKDGLYGYIDGESTSFAIELQFKSASDFSSGVAAVESAAGAYYYIDKKGGKAFPTTYTYASGFSEGYASVVVDSSAYIINEKGELLVEQPWQEVGKMSSGMMAVKKDSTWGYLSVKK